MPRVSIGSAPEAASTNDSTWGFQADLESEITTLATWCQVLQQQQEPLQAAFDQASYDVQDDEELNDVEDFATNMGALFINSSTNNLKHTFLDALAEIVCCKKEASFVTCTSLIEKAEECKILVARNASWTDTDQRFLEYLAEFLERAETSGQAGDQHVHKLFVKTTEYYAPRLRYHAQQALNHILIQPATEDLVTSLHECISGKTPPQSLMKIVDQILKSPHLNSYATIACKPNRRAQLVRELRFLHRPHTACGILVDAANKIASFQSVHIHLLTGFAAKRVPKSLRSPVPITTKYKSRKQFDKIHAKPKWVHAEIRMVTYLLSHTEVGDYNGYLGISKKTCFCCGKILENLGDFTTRGNHGKVYGQWTMPPSVALPQRYAKKVDNAVRHLRAALILGLQDADAKAQDAVKESSITTPVPPPQAKSTIFNKHIPDPRDQDREATWLSLSRSARLCDAHESPSNHDFETSEAEENKKHVADIERTTPRCVSCGSEGDCLRPCAKCATVAYCGIECSKAHWPIHKYRCRLDRPLDVADNLVRACQSGEFPIDDEVAIAFGFRHFVSGADRLRLFRIYRVLVQHTDIDDEELREAWQKNELSGFLLFRGAQLPSFLIGDKIEWLRQQTGFAANSIADFASAIAATARNHLNEEDRNKYFQQLQPLEKRQAFLFYGQILNGYIPDVGEDLWLTLGFCTAKKQEDTKDLAMLYEKLIARCHFDEFWTAMRDSTMIALCSMHGLGPDAAKLRNFPNLMKSIGKWHHSVWELKKYTLTTDVHPLRSVQVDYGFLNCSNARERMELRFIYAQYFAQGRDELLLHEACVQGRLAPFLRSVLGPLSLLDDRLHNPYPLPSIPGITYQNYDGIVAENVIGCPASDYELVCKMVEAEGQQAFVMPIPDEDNEMMKRRLHNQAAHTTGRMYTSKHLFGGKMIQSFSVGR